MGLDLGVPITRISDSCRTRERDARWLTATVISTTVDKAKSVPRARELANVLDLPLHLFICFASIWFGRSQVYSSNRRSSTVPRYRLILFVRAANEHATNGPTISAD